MASSDQIDTRYHCQYIHDVLSCFYKDLLEYFSDYLYPRFEWKVISTYNKAVEYISKRDQLGYEANMPNLPAIILDPSGDFSLDTTYGSQPWRFPNLYPGFIKRIFDPIYQDENVIINVGFSRIKGECQISCLLSSIYEHLDLKMFLNLIFSGQDRYIYPEWFNGFIILPPEIYNYTYSNPYTGESYTINIPELTTKLIKTTNINEAVFPFRYLPKFKMTSMSDGSVRLGGADRMPDWRLTFTVEYEVELPSFLLLESNYLAKNINFNVNYGSCYSQNPMYNNLQIADEISSFTGSTNFGLSNDESSVIEYPEEREISDERKKTFKTRYFHIITQEQIDSTSNIIITLDEQITDNNLLTLNCKYGMLKYGDHYTLDEDGLSIEINKLTTTLDENDILELYIFKYISPD